MSTVLTQTVKVSAALSNLPPSFDGSTIRFQLALFSLTVCACLGLMTGSWMAREIWRDRFYAHPREPLFSLRLVFLVASIGAVIRCTPEVAYMTTFREVNVQMTTQILLVKRWCDAIALFPVVTFHVLIWLHYYGMCAQLSACRDVPHPPYLAKDRTKRMIFSLVLIFIISALIAIGKG